MSNKLKAYIGNVDEDYDIVKASISPHLFNNKTTHGFLTHVNNICNTLYKTLLHNINKINYL